MYIPVCNKVFREYDYIYIYIYKYIYYIIFKYYLCINISLIKPEMILVYMINICE